MIYVHNKQTTTKILQIKEKTGKPVEYWAKDPDSKQKCVCQQHVCE